MTEPVQAIDSAAFEARLEVIKAQIRQACARVGRSSRDVTVIAVTKTFPIEYVRAAIAAGHLDFGENRLQELEKKAAHIPGRIKDGPVTWHMIGHVQRNKAKLAVEIADLVHGVDSLRLAEALNVRAELVNRRLPCLLQVNTSGEESKYGADPRAVPDLVKRIVDLRGLHLQGLMTIARPALDPEHVRHEFRLLRDLAGEIGVRESEVEMRYLSMGMSGDYQVAVEEGSTHVRIGTALFGPRS